MYIVESEREKGLGEYIDNKIEKFYREIGVDRIELIAQMVGKYFWAKRDYDFESESTLFLWRNKLNEYMKEKHIDLIDVNTLKRPKDFADLSFGKNFLCNYVDNWNAVKYLGDVT